MTMPRRVMLHTVRGVFVAAAIAASTAVVWTQGLGYGGRPFDEYFLRFGRPAQPAAGIAVRAGRLFDAKAGTMLQNQVILIKGEIITDVGPANRIQIPAGRPGYRSEQRHRSAGVDRSPFASDEFRRRALGSQRCRSGRQGDGARDAEPDGRLYHCCRHGSGLVGAHRNAERDQPGLDSGTSHSAGGTRAESPERTPATQPPVRTSRFTWARPMRCLRAKAPFKTACWLDHGPLVRWCGSMRGTAPTGSRST